MYTFQQLTLWKMCEAFDLKVNFVPLPRATALPRTPHRGVDQTTTVLVCVEDVPWTCVLLTTQISTEQLFFEGEASQLQLCTLLPFFNRAWR
ncbi:hypothetical protein TNCV_4537831 [Trichonephila clavipes]|nr:hypothetical protein TNCV_4537831 [Trichonephila clavipes]